MQLCLRYVLQSQPSRSTLPFAILLPLDKKEKKERKKATNEQANRISPQLQFTWLLSNISAMYSSNNRNTTVNLFSCENWTWNYITLGLVENINLWKVKTGMAGL